MKLSIYTLPFALLIVLALSFNQLIAQQSVKVASISMKGTYSKGLSGIMIDVSLSKELAYENDITFAYILNGSPRNRDFIKLREPGPIKKFQIFYPYCQLFTTSGKQKIQFELKEISEEDKKAKTSVEGVTTSTIEVEVPKMHKVKLKVDHVSVSKTNRKGNAWDYHIFASKESDNYPDLVYTIETDYNELGRGGVKVVLYSSNRQNDTLHAIWASFSDGVYFCEGDKLTVCIKDGDTVFHDVIGCIPLDELRELDTIKDLSFGEVSAFSATLLVE